MAAYRRVFLVVEGLKLADSANWRSNFEEASASGKSRTHYGHP